MCPPAPGTLPPVAPSKNEAPHPIPDQVPKDSTSQAAYTYACHNLHWTILNHSVRVYLYAHALSQRSDDPKTRIYSSEPEKKALLFTACVMHDIGTADAHDGELRFEVEGGDAAAKFLRERGVDEVEAHDVWIAIALHTSPQIAERISPLARLVRLGVGIDFKVGSEFMALTNESEVSEVERMLPRGEIEKVLGDVVAEQGLRQPGKAPRNTWPAGLVEWRRVHGVAEGVNGGF